MKEQRYGAGWGEARQATLKRDGYKCRACMKKGKLHVHHITPFRYFYGDDKRANHLDNLIALCPTCHQKAHRGDYGETLLKIPVVIPISMIVKGGYYFAQVGQRLNHPLFGIGIVEDVQFPGDTILTIRFDNKRWGKKQIMAGLVKWLELNE